MPQPSETKQPATGAAPLCPVCETPTCRMTYDMETYHIFRCDTCGLQFVDFPYDESEIKDMEYYWGEDAFSTETATLRRWAESEIAKVEKFEREGRLLDVGCSFGFILDAAHNHGWRVSGVEISRKVVERYLGEKAKTWDVFNGRLEEARYPDAAFDVVTMFDVIEHLADPPATLREVARIMRPGGLFVVETPREESLYKLIAHGLARVTRGRSVGFIRNAYNPHPGGHRFGFTHVALKKLLSKSGFTPVRLEKRMMLLRPFVRANMRVKSNLVKKLLFNGAALIIWGVSRALGMQNRMVVYARKTGAPDGT
jgi:SAM-dependent methyltransferase